MDLQHSESQMDLSSFLSSSFLNHLTGFALGVLASYIVARTTRATRRLVFDRIQRHPVFVDFGESSFRLTYQNEPIESLHLLTLRVWNRGTEHVRGSDISKISPLLIRFDSFATVLGEPRMRTPWPDAGLRVVQPAKNEFHLDFEIMNPGEWAELVFYYSGDLNASVTVTGRIAGQKEDVSIVGRERIAPPLERLTTLTALVLITGAPIVLVVSILYGLYANIPLARLLFEVDTLPEPLRSALGFGLLGSAIMLIYSVQRGFRRATNPRGYRFPDEYGPSNFEVYKAWWKTVLTGKRYRTQQDVLDDREEESAADAVPPRA